MPAPICIPCGRTMRCHENGVPLLICADVEKTDHYQLHQADAYKCPACETIVAIGLGRAIEKHEERFARELGYAGKRIVRVF